MTTTRREFLKRSAWAAGSAAFFGCSSALPRGAADAALPPKKSLVVAVAARNILAGGNYDPDTVGRAFAAGLKELSGLKTAADAWSSLFSPGDVVGIKVNCVGAPRISTSPASVAAAVAGLKSAGVRENDIIVWDRSDRGLQRAGFTINRGTSGLRAMGASSVSEAVLPWVEGYDRGVYISLADGTLRKFHDLSRRGFARDGTHREIFNSLTWLWALALQGNEKAKKYEPEIRRLYTDYNDRAGIQRIAEEVADEFAGVTIEDEEKSFFAEIVTRGVTKLVNIAVLKHNEDSGVTLATKNIALGVTTNKVRFHVDYCARAIPEILAAPCLRDKMVLHIGEAAKISTVSVAGAQIAYDNRLFFSRDPVAMDRIGLDLLEEKRLAQGLESIRPIATHVAACAARGLGTDDLRRIDLRTVGV